MSATVEQWCLEFVSTTDLAAKLAPPDPGALEFEVDAPERRIAAPGRPVEWVVVERSPPAPRAGPRLLHTLVHHELQAAELFAWAILAFPRTPQAFRAGLLALCREELAHLQLYLGHMRALGTEFGAHPVRDWFWQRVTQCGNPAAFLALQGLGLEGANLDHCPRVAAQFREAGDETGARILERVQRDEIGHVAFAAHWFEHFTGAPLEYGRWRAALPAPLTPALMQGRPLALAARRAAGMSADFLAQLAAEPAIDPRRRA
jgi:uncharacterized ferritin-like protein (DUF455 family)